MNLALKNNPGLKAAGTAVDTAEADLAKARARFLPQVNLGEAYGDSNNPSQVFMYKLNQGQFTQQDFAINNLNNPKPYQNWRSQLSINQPVFQAGQAYLGYQQARLGREAAGAFVLSQRQQLLYQVTHAFFGLQLAREKLSVVAEAKKTAQAHLNIIESRYRAGEGLKADVLSAQVHLAQLVQDEMSAQGQVEIGKSALVTAVGLKEIAARPLAPAPREPAPLPGKLDEILSLAQEKRPDLKRLALTARVARQEAAKARLNFLPQVKVVGEYDVDQRNLFNRGEDSYAVMAVMNFNLFNGLADLARVRETRAQETKARELKKELENQVAHEVTAAAQELKVAHERLHVARAAAAQARESLRLIRLRYEEGLTILVDLLTAEVALKNAELGRVTALFETHLAQAGMELALGTLTGPPQDMAGK
jgi:outer membrane protein